MSNYKPEPLEFPSKCQEYFKILEELRAEIEENTISDNDGNRISNRPYVIGKKIWNKLKSSITL